MLGRGLIGGAANCGIRAGMTFGAADRTGSSRLPGTGEPGVWSASGRKTFPRPARCIPATVPAHSAALKAGRKSSPDGDRGHSPPLDRRPHGGSGGLVLLVLAVDPREDGSHVLDRLTLGQIASNLQDREGDLCCVPDLTGILDHRVVLLPLGE